MDNKLESLIEQGKQFNFANNSYHSEHGVYSRATDDFLAWVAGIEHYLMQNYDDDSGPIKLFKSIDKTQFSDHHQSTFENQLNILRGVLLSCKTIPASKLKKKDDNQILVLIKSPVFWTVIVVLMGAAFSFGLYFGNTKFDKNLIELTQYKKDLEDTIKTKEIIIQTLRRNSDSALNILGHMPYSEMNLDTLEFRKVQTNIESVGAVLSLNK